MVLQLEQNLKNDVAGIYKNEILEKFSQASSEVRIELNQGVEPEQYEKLNRLLKALEASTEIVEQVWTQK